MLSEKRVLKTNEKRATENRLEFPVRDLFRDVSLLIQSYYG